jgi:hypothetical protein
MMADDDGGLTLDRLQHDILAPQLDSFLAAAPDEAARAPYIALREAIEKMEVPAALDDRLGAIAEVLLSSGRVRAAYGPGAELSLWALFRKTRRGRAIDQSIEAMNAALRRLNGQPLESAIAVARGPGAYALTLKTPECQLVLRFEAVGVRLENAEVGTE